MPAQLEAAEDAFKAGRTGEGLGLLAQVIAEAGPEAPAEAFRRQAAVFVGLGDFGRALAACQAGLNLHPEDFDLWNILGVVQRRLGAYPQALAALDRALEIRPDAGGALFNKVNVYNDMKAARPALEIALDLVRRNPTNSECRRMAGVACRLLHDWEQARTLLDAAIQLQPASVAAWIDRIALETELQRHHEALALLDQALAAAPGSAKLLESRSILLRRAGRAAEAEQFLVDLLARHDIAWAHHQLGRIIADRDRPRATEHLRRAVALEPANAEYRVALAQSLGASRSADEGADLEEAYGLLKSVRQSGPIPPDQIFVACGIYLGVGDYEGLKSLGGFAELGRAWALGGDVGPLLMHMARVQTADDRRELVEQHRLWGRAVQAQADSNPVVRAEGGGRRPGKLRLGFMSADLRNHVAGLFALPLFDFADRERFEIFCYSFNREAEDGVQRHIASKVDAFRWTPQISDRDAAQMIADDDLDLLIEIGGATYMNRLGVMAYRPARLQASWLGYPHSGGLETIDHIVGDPRTLPEDPALLIEKPLVMPRTWLAMGPGQFRDLPAPDPVLAEERNGFVTFGTANQPNKYSPELLRTWAKVLAAVPDSRFLFLRPEGGAPSFRDNMRKAFAAEDVSPERVLFEPVRGKHLPLYGRIDVSLDTFPLTGGTTTCESLWMGVPVVSLVGEAMFERLSYSLLANVGLDDLAADTLDGYVAAAVRLAGDRARRKTLRATLRDRIRTSPLGQVETFARDFYDMAAAAIASAAG